jgi:hypothetical protein
MRFLASPSIRDSADRVGSFRPFGVVKLGYPVEGVRPRQKKALRGRRHRTHEERVS